MRRFALALCTLSFSMAAGCQEAIVDHVPVDMRLPDAPECREALGTLTLTGLGDFPTRDVDVAQFDASGAPVAPVTHFQPATLAFSASARAVSGSWDVFGWASRDSLADTSTLVLRPLGRSCPLADPEARLPVGAALAVIDQARVMFVGGVDESGEATRRVAVLHVREERVELPLVDRVVPIAFAAATLVPEGDAVLVTGGASSVDGEGRDTWERIPLDGGMATFGALVDRRRDHAAVAVDVGDVHGVLLVGGTDGRSTLQTIEWVDARADAGAVLGARLAVGRIAPQLVWLDATHLAIVGGTDARGAAVTSIEVLDLEHDVLRALSTTLAAPDWIAPLPSGRLAWASAGALAIVTIPLDAGQDAQVDVSVALPSVLDPVASALASGRIVLEGHRPDGTRLAFSIDPGVASVSTLASSRVPRAIVAMPDGTSLELAATGASTRRDDRLTPFDAPPPSYLFAADRATLALDAAARWADVGGALSPTVEAARVDVPVLRFARFDALLDATGPCDLLVTGAHLEPLATITIADDAISYGSCSLSRAPGDGRVHVVRDAGGAIRVGTERGAGLCTGRVTTSRVGVGVVARSGAALRSLALQRGEGAD